MLTKAKDMTQEQITHTYCSWCKHRLLLAGEDHWGCNLDESKREELCLYRLALKEQEGEDNATH